MGWAAIPKLAFVGPLIVGVVSGELRGKGLAVFVALGAGAWFGLPYLPRGGDFVTPTLAILDVVSLATSPDASRCNDYVCAAR